VLRNLQRSERPALHAAAGVGSGRHAVRDRRAEARLAAVDFWLTSFFLKFTIGQNYSQ
jgi:preprotein translocase subunit SecG